MIHVLVNHLFRRRLADRAIALLEGRNCESCTHSFYSSVKGCYLHKIPKYGSCRKWKDMGEDGLNFRMSVRNMGR